MNKQLNALFSVLIRALTALTVMVLAFVIYFIVKEALPTFDEVAVPDFLLGQRWMPIAYTGEPSFGIFNFIAATLYVSLVAMVLAVTVGLGAAIYLSCVATERMRGILYPFVDLLAGIPSVIYGFMGLTLMVKLFIRAGVHTGSCVLAAGILLAVMLLPFLISSCSETMLKVRERVSARRRRPGYLQMAYGGNHCPSGVVEEHTAVHDSGHRTGHGGNHGSDDGHWKCKPVPLPAWKG